MSLDYLPKTIRDHHDHLSAARFFLAQAQQYHQTLIDGPDTETHIGELLEMAKAHALVGILQVLAEGVVQVHDEQP